VVYPVVRWTRINVCNIILYLMLSHMFVFDAIAHVCSWCYRTCLYLMLSHMFVFDATALVCIWCYSTCLYLMLSHMFVFDATALVCIWCYRTCLYLMLPHMFVFDAIAHVCIWCYRTCLYLLLSHLFVFDAYAHVYISGEGSPSNLHLNSHWRELPGNEFLSEPKYVILDYIHHLIPRAKIIVIFRNPIDR